MANITEDKARDLAIKTIDIFEDLFSERDIYLPDENREDDDFDDAVDDYDPEEDDCEACIYGSIYYDIEDYFVDLILSNKLQTDSDFEDLAYDMISYMNEILKDVDMEISNGPREDEDDKAPICREVETNIFSKIMTVLMNNLVPDSNAGMKNVDGYRICSSIVIPYDKFKEDFKKATGDNDVHMYIDIDGIVINSSVKDYYPLLAKYFGVKEVTSIHADDDCFYINVWVSFVK